MQTNMLQHKIEEGLALLFPAGMRAVVLALLLAVGAAAAPTNFESGVLSIHQTSATLWTSVTFTRTFATPPVVVMGPATYANTGALVMRVRNVTNTGFEYQVDEWDYLDGPHATETVHFFALTPGTHVFGAQTWEVGRLAALNRTATTVNFPAGDFTSTPVVLAQVETTNNLVAANNPHALKTRLSNVGATSFQVQLETEEANGSLTLANEGIGYIAVSPGKGYLDGKAVNAILTGATVTQAFSTVLFPETATNPVFLAQAQTRNDTDPGELRMQNLLPATVQLSFQEEKSVNTNVSHTAEVAGCLVLGDMPGELAAKIEIGEIVVAQASRAQWTTVAFSQSYTTPVVVMGPPSYALTTPLTVRVRNVTPAGFEFQLNEWDFTDGIHNTPERLSYLVMESGSYAVGGLLWEAGRRAGVTQTPANTNFTGAYPAAPVVFAQVATNNDANAVTARVHDVAAANFQVELDESENDTTPHASETVHYLALQTGVTNFFANGPTNGMRVEAGSSSGQTNTFRWQNFNRLNADPFLFAALQTINDTDPATLRWRYLFADKVELSAQEDAHPSIAGETVNNTHGAETVAWLAVQGAVDKDEDGAPDDWELTHGLNPNNPADGALDPDGDLLTNQQEFHNGSDPAVFTGGTLSLSIVTTDAFEKEGTPARIRVNRVGGFAQLSANFTLAGSAATVTDKGSASPSDYVVKDSGGNVLTGSITLPANATSVDVYIHPVLDALNEYPEGLVLTLATSAQYVRGTPNNKTVVINDATDIPANEKLFVGIYVPQDTATGLAQTYASGVATFILNGPNNKARFSSDFSGLTTPQLGVDGTHIHISNGAGDGTNGGSKVYYGVNPTGNPPPVDVIPTGPFTDYPWTITDPAGFKSQEMIDALYEKTPGLFLYLNVHTSRYSGGEIRAKFKLQNGSPVFTPPGPVTLENLADDAAVKRDVARFLTQATFGPTETDITTLFNSIASPKTTAANRTAAYNAWLAAQWALPATKLYDYHYAADQQEWFLRGQDHSDPLVLNPPASAAAWQQFTAPSGLPRKTTIPTITIAAAAGGCSPTVRKTNCASASPSLWSKSLSSPTA